MSKFEDFEKDVDAFAEQLVKLRDKITMVLDEVYLILSKIDILQTKEFEDLATEPPELKEALLNAKLYELIEALNVIKDDFRLSLEYVYIPMILKTDVVEGDALQDDHS